MKGTQIGIFLIISDGCLRTDDNVLPESLLPLGEKCILMTLHTITKGDKTNINYFNMLLWSNGKTEFRETVLKSSLVSLVDRHVISK